MNRAVSLPLRNGIVLAFAMAFALCLHTAVAQVVTVPTSPQIGSSNPITAEPLVARPATKPCVVQLFQNLEFADFSNKTYSYTPPAKCPGPWAKVVFTADFTVTEGRQYDRTAEFYLGTANIFYGTTSEPRSALSPSWHVESDVTDLSAIFKTAQSGEAVLGNFVGVSGGVTYDGIIYANAALEFYPASWSAPAPVVPDIVIPVNGSGGTAANLNTTTDQVTATLNLPTNVQKVYLDVISQSQSNDEFWYFCVPNDQTSTLESCGNTAFRETEITIDGQPAGVAPVYPWIYTGGIDPYLWEPITGVQTLNFKPYRVDLTPFAGLLSDGNTHSVAVSVFNADSYFAETDNLLVYTDHYRKKTSGGILSNTLTLAPTPEVTENVSTDATGTTTGTVSVGSNRKFKISGYVDGSLGRVETTVEQTVDFMSTQQFTVNANTDVQNAVQTSTVDSKTTTQAGFLKTGEEYHFSFPLTVDYSYVVNADGSANQVTSTDQHFSNEVTKTFEGFPYYADKASEEVTSTDTLPFDASGNFLGSTGSKTTATYKSSNSNGGCYSRTLVAEAQKLTLVTNGKGCR